MGNELKASSMYRQSKSIYGWYAKSIPADFGKEITAAPQSKLQDLTGPAYEKVDFFRCDEPFPAAAKQTVSSFAMAGDERRLQPE